MFGMLVSETWMEKLPMAMVELFRGGMSDHVVLITRLCALAASRRAFRAFNSWFDSQEVVSLVENAWSIVPEGNPLTPLSSNGPGTKPTDQEKLNRMIQLKDELQAHFEDLEKNARQLSHQN